MHAALLVLVLPTLLSRPASARTDPSLPPHPNAVLDVLVPAGAGLTTLEANEIRVQATGESELVGSVVITLPGGAVLRPRNGRVFVSRRSETGEVHLYVEPPGEAR